MTAHCFESTITRRTPIILYLNMPIYPSRESYSQNWEGLEYTRTCPLCMAGSFLGQYVT